MARSSSPDSSISISSLLASCSLETSTSLSRSLCSVEYKDKLYDSASKALEAYIKDYDESLQSSMTCTGKITLRTSSKHSNKSRASVNPDLKRKKPFSSTRRSIARDPDLFSLTTDDLLSFPSDGSLPLTESYTFKQNTFQSDKRLHSSLSRKHAPLKSSQHASSLNRTKLNCLNTENYNTLKHVLFTESRKCEDVSHRTSRENKPPFHSQITSPYYLKESSLPTVPKAYPRWLTSQKSDLSVSGLTSVPEANYPIWLKNYDLLSDSDNQSIFKSMKAQASQTLQDTRSMHQLDSMRLRFHDTHNEDDGFKKVNTNTFVKEAKTYAPVWNLNEPLNTSMKSDPTDLLLEKLEQTPDFSYKQLSSPLKYNRSPRTEDVLEAERSWEKNVFAIKAPVPVLCEDDDKDLEDHAKSHLVQEFLSDCVKKDNQITPNTFSGGNHHGPVEALKHMLFNLQTFQQSFSQGKIPENTCETKKISKSGDCPLQSFDQEMFPVNRSLQKALHHLTRLKELVGDNSIKQDQEKNQEN
ncbi:lung adenoma susceptibility protein 2 isoform 1-T2 [Discoglossus pictus]